MEAVVYDGADVVQVQCGHLFDSLGGFLESRQTHVEVDLIQVSTVKCVELHKRKQETKCCLTYNVMNQVLNFERLLW